jgi:hypothetical protein
MLCYNSINKIIRLKRPDIYSKDTFIKKQVAGTDRPVRIVTGRYRQNLYKENLCVLCASA